MGVQANRQMACMAAKQRKISFYCGALALH